MKSLIEKSLITAVDQYLATISVNLENLPIIEVNHVKDTRHGDFATNIAMILAKPLGQPPRKIAEGIIQNLPEIQFLQKTEIAGPGFINFYLTGDAYFQTIPEILNAGIEYGKSDYGNNKKILLEYVSTNPTGPIHVGHGRGAAYGSILANLLLASGYDVTREYYVNDTGRQMDILTISVWLRLLQNYTEKEIPFPSNAYHGQYITNIANRLYEKDKGLPVPDLNELLSIINEHAEEDIKLDRIITLAKSTLKNDYNDVVFTSSLNEILTDIKQDLEEFGVTFDNWFSEKSLVDSGDIKQCISNMDSTGDIYEKDGAKWFASSRYGDEKDRVVIRENGQTTYFASDIAYHINKYERGFDEIVNIWGADHHGYISRVKGAIRSLGENTEKLKVIMVQFANLIKGKEKLQMSTRSGEYVTLRQLRDEVGNDATRFFYVMRKTEQHLDFDLDLAKSESNANPVYYIQYAHARICSVFKQLEERGISFDSQSGHYSFSKLEAESELDLVKSLARFKEVVLSAASNFEPHLLSFYLRELANDFHSYYNSCQFIVDDSALRQARLCLIFVTRQVLKNGLDLLGVSAPEEM